MKKPFSECCDDEVMGGFCNKCGKRCSTYLVEVDDDWLCPLCGRDCGADCL